jgi:hypothetical protein
VLVPGPPDDPDDLRSSRALGTALFVVGAITLLAVGVGFLYLVVLNAPTA